MKRMRAALVIVIAAMLFPAAALAIRAGEKAPAFSLSDAGGKTVNLHDLKGRVVYVDFWASWCPPCKKALPWLSELQARYEPKGFTVLAVNLDSERGAAEELLSATGAKLQVLFDPIGQVPQRYGVQGMPYGYLIDRDGYVAAVHKGFRDGDRDAFVTKLERLLVP